MDPMRILYIRPVADSSHAMDISAVLQEAARSDTTVDVVSLSKDRPRHLEYHAYEAIAVADIVKHVRAAANKYDGHRSLRIRDGNGPQSGTTVLNSCWACKMDSKDDRHRTPLWTCESTVLDACNRHDRYRDTQRLR